MNITEVKAWALKGAEQRLVEIASEARAIFRNFPELRGKGRGFESAGTLDGAAGRQSKTPARRRRKMSAEARKAVATRMRKYWAAKRREGQAAGAGAPNQTASADVKSAGRKAAPKRARAPRKMSAAARKRISQAQKARWAKQRSAAEPTAAASAIKPAARGGVRKKK